MKLIWKCLKKKVCLWYSKNKGIRKKEQDVTKQKQSSMKRWGSGEERILEMKKIHPFVRINSRLSIVKDLMTWKIMRNSTKMQFREMKIMEGQVCMADRRSSNHSSHRIFYKGMRRSGYQNGGKAVCWKIRAKTFPALKTHIENNTKCHTWKLNEAVSGQKHHGVKHWRQSGNLQRY